MRFSCGRERFSHGNKLFSRGIAGTALRTLLPYPAPSPVLIRTDLPNRDEPAMRATVRHVDLHEKTIRSICRLVFVACCAVPTLMTIVILLWRATPYHRERQIRRVETAIRDATGLNVGAGDVSFPTPSRIAIDSLELRDVETEQEVARCRKADIMLDDTQFVVELQQPELQSAQMQSAWRLLHDRLLRRPEHLRTMVRLVASDLTLHDPVTPMTMRNVDAWVGLEADDVVAGIQAVPASAPSMSPILMTIRRQRDGGQTKTLVTFNSGDHALPLSAYRAWLPETLGELGDTATIRGTVRCLVQERGVLLDLGGCTIDGIQVDRLLTGTAHRMSGWATVMLDRGIVQPGGRLDLTGRVRIRGGAIGGSMMQQLSEHLAVEIPEVSEDQRIAFDWLCCQFKIDQHATVIEGVCRHELGDASMPPEVLMASAGQPLAIARGLEVPTVAMASMLASRHSLLVPVTPQNHLLLSLLPPPVQPPAKVDQAILRTTARSIRPPSIRQPSIRQPAAAVATGETGGASQRR